MENHEINAIKVFFSRGHPGDAPASLVYGRRLLRPLVMCLIPWMILSLLAVLTFRDPLPYMIWGLPVAYSVATAWTVFDVRRELSEIYLKNGQAAMRSLWEVALKQRRLEWEAVLHVKRIRTGLLLFMGREVYEIHESDWDEFDELKTALRSAALSS